MEVGFHHGVLADTYEEQANKQGFTLGNYAELSEIMGNVFITGHIHGIITDSEYEKILKRFQKKILVANLKRLEGE